MQRTNLHAAALITDLSICLLQVLVPGDDTGSTTTVVISLRSPVSSSLSSHALQPTCCALFPILSLLPWVCQLLSSAHACRPRHPRSTGPRHQGTLCSQRTAALQVQYIQPGATVSSLPSQYTATRISARFRSRHSRQLQAFPGACSQPVNTTRRRSTSGQLPGQQWPPASTAWRTPQLPEARTAAASPQYQQRHTTPP